MMHGSDPTSKVQRMPWQTVAVALKKILEKVQALENKANRSESVLWKLNNSPSSGAFAVYVSSPKL